MRALFVVKGRGYSHAIAAMALTAKLPHIEWLFASYGTGLRTLRAAGHQVIAVEASENDDWLSSLPAWSAVIAGATFDAVVSHEEPAAIMAARLAGVPSAYVAGWLPTHSPQMTQAVAMARKSIIWCDPGIFPALPNTEFVGPLIREFEAKLPRDFTDTAAMAGEIVVIAGGYANERRVPLAKLIMPATTTFRLIWVDANEEVQRESERFAHVACVPFQEKIEHTIRHADLVITAGNRSTVQDCAAMGVPSISLSPQTNPIDDVLVARIRSNVALNLRAVTPDILREWINRVLIDHRPFGESASTVGQISERLDHALQDSKNTVH